MISEGIGVSLAGGLKVSENIGNPLKNLLQGPRGYWQPSENSSVGILNFWQLYIFLRWLLILSDHEPDGIEHPVDKLPKGIGNLQGNFQKSFPISKQRSILFAIPLKNLNDKIQMRQPSANCSRGYSILSGKGSEDIGSPLTNMC